MRYLSILVLIALTMVHTSCKAQEDKPSLTKEHAMRLSCPDFKDKELMPRKFSYHADNLSPTLIIEGVPEGAESLVLIVDDPDAPMGTWVHWVVFDIPVTSRIEEGTVPGRQGITDFGTMNYGGPAPPSGTHRYFFKLYALDTKLGLKEGIKKSALEKAMEGHILEEAELVGLYKR